MVNTISLQTSELISLGLTTFLYGLFFTLFFITVVMTFYLRGFTRQHHMRVLPVSFLMFLVATTHLFVLWVRAVQAFISQKGGSALAFYDDLSDATSVVRVSCLVTQSVLGDLVMIWRLYVVYDKRFWVVVPAILLVTAYTVVGTFAIIYIERSRPGTDIFDVAKAYITAYFSMTMSSNIVCSGAIAARIFSAQTNGNLNARPYWRIVVIIVESSVLYSLGILAALVCFVCGTNGQYAAADAIVPLVGIVFCLIAIQIRVHVSSTTGSYIFSKEPTTTGTNRSRSRENDGEDFPDKWTQAIPMTIRVTRQTTTTRVLDYLDSGDSRPCSLSGIEKSAA